MKTLATLLIFALSILPLSSQTLKSDKVITLANPSFEDTPQVGKAPVGWQDCGFPGETPPDIQPNPTFNVTAKPQHGNTYLGMAVRDNDTWEKIGQKLSSPIEANQCYQFSIHLQRSQTYFSRSQLTGQNTNYNTPAKLIIWGGNDWCAKKERLAESAVIRKFDWELHTFIFRAASSHSYILFEVFYETPILFPYNGNLLLDNASDFTPTSCDSVKTVISTSKPPSPSYDLDNKKKLQAAKKKGIFHYTSVLESTEKEAVLHKIDEYLKTHPPYTAMIHVKEKNRKKGKKSKKYLEKKLAEMGWTREDFTIEVIKINK